MHKIDSPGSTIDGHFTEGSPSEAILATVMDADWPNAVQDELVNVIEGAGLTLNPADNTQLQQAIAATVGAIPGARNLIINGDMRVAQRRKSTTFSNAVLQLSGFVIDRWFHAADTGAGTGSAVCSRQPFAVGQTAVPGDPIYFLRHNQSAAATAGNPLISQKIESVRGFSGGQLTLSLWAVGLAAFSMTARVVQNFGTGGSPSTAVVCGTSVVSVTTAWQRFTVTVTLPSMAGKVLGSNDNDHLLIEFVLPQGATFRLDLARVQVERGAAAGDFEVRPLAQEISYCRRYYEKSWELETDPGQATSLGARRWFASPTPHTIQPEAQAYFLTTKRAVPSIAWYSIGAASPGEVGESSASTVTGTSDISRTATGYPTTTASLSTNAIAGAHWTADAEL